MKRRIITALLYAATAIATANWIDWALNPVQPYGHPLLSKVALAGSLMFVIGCVVSLFTIRYAIIMGSVAAVLSWPYFGLLAAGLPWKDFFWFVRIHEHGAAQVAAVVALGATTIYSIAFLRSTMKSFVRGQI